jgi:hypothetical protein
MKKGCLYHDRISTSSCLSIFLGVFLYSLPVFGQHVGISNSGLLPDPSAILDINADSLGLLVPRTDTSAVLSPANGLIIYDTSLQHLMLFDGVGWSKLLKESAFTYYYADRDGDAYGDQYGALFAQAPLPGYVTDNSDCDDWNSLISPAASEMCDSIDNNCDGVIDEGAICPNFQVCENGACVSCCLNNGGSTCTGATNLGTLCGDVNGPLINNIGCGNAWFKVTLEECDTGPFLNNLEITVSLNSIPPGMDYDLYLFSPCSTQLGFSNNSGNASEQIMYTVVDMTGDNTTIFYIHVVLWSGVYCLNWNLSIAGN